MTSLKNNGSLREGINFFGTRNEITLVENLEKLEKKSDLPLRRKEKVIFEKNSRLAMEIIFYLIGIGIFSYSLLQFF